MNNLVKALTTCYQSAKIDTENGIIDSILVDGNKVTFTIQDGLISEVGVNGITINEAIEYLEEAK